MPRTANAGARPRRIRGSASPMLTRADRPVSLAADEVPVEPAVGSDRVAADARFPGILFLEVRTVLRSYPTACKATACPLLNKGASAAARGCRPKKPSRSTTPPGLPGSAIAMFLAQFVIARVLVRDDQVEPIHAAAQEDDHEGLAATHGEDVIRVEADVGEQPGRADAAVGGSKRGGGLEEKAAGDVHVGKVGNERRRGSLDRVWLGRGVAA